MGQQFLRSRKESNRMRELRVQIKRSFIHPLGMNREYERLAERLKYMDTQTTNLSSRSLEDPQQLLAKRYLLPRARFKPDENVNGQAAPPERQVSSQAEGKHSPGHYCQQCPAWSDSD
jgi:hypothetical protein